MCLYEHLYTQVLQLRLNKQVSVPQETKYWWVLQSIVCSSEVNSLCKSEIIKAFEIISNKRLQII
jgi:hypothetical protein